MSQEHESHEKKDHEHHKHEDRDFKYTVDGKLYESEEENVTGKYIKSKISGFNPTYSLFLEGHGKDPDQLINDDTTISLKGHRKFYTVPPATFGAQ